MTSQQPTPEAVEAVAAAMFGDVTNRSEPQRKAEAALAFIRDAIHRDGADADAIREALGLRVETTHAPRWVDDGPCDQACGRVICGPDHRKQRLDWADMVRVVTTWRDAA